MYKVTPITEKPIQIPTQTPKQFVMLPIIEETNTRKIKTIWCKTICSGIIAGVSCCGCCGFIKSPRYLMNSRFETENQNLEKQKFYNCFNWSLLCLFSNIYFPASCCACCCGFCCSLTPNETLA